MACLKCHEVTSCQYVWKGLNYYINFLPVVRQCWKLEFDVVIFVGSSQACLAMLIVLANQITIVSKKG